MISRLFRSPHRQSFSIRLSLVNLLFSLGICLCSSLQSQTPTTNQPKPADHSTQPIDLPEFVITGKEVLNVKATTKQIPARTPPTPRDQLDSLNRVQKQPSLLLRPKPLPTSTLTQSFANGFVQGEFGMFVTPAISAGWRTKFGGYHFDMDARYRRGGDYIVNANNSQAHVNLHSSFVAPQEYFLFGGSTTNSRFTFDQGTFNLFANSDPPSRRSRTVDIGVETTGEFKGVNFTLGAGWSGFSLLQEKSSWESRPSEDNSLGILAKLSEEWEHSSLGAALDLDLRSYNGKSNKLTNGFLFGSANSLETTLIWSAGMQWALTSLAIDRVVPLVVAEFSWRIDQDFTARFKAQTGMEKNSFSQMFAVNRFIADSAEVDFTQTIFGLSVGTHYHPTQLLQVGVRVGFSVQNRIVAFDSSAWAVFLPKYISGTAVEFSADASWQPSDRHTFSAATRLISTTLESGTVLPYQAILDLQLHHLYKWSRDFLTEVKLDYIGKRFANTDNVNSLPNWIGVGLNVRYSISSDFDVFLQAENLLGTTLILWEGYRERGRYVGVGARKKF